MKKTARNSEALMNIKKPPTNVRGFSRAQSKRGDSEWNLDILFDNLSILCTKGPILKFGGAVTSINWEIK